MKVRVLYPTAFEGLVKKPPEAGDIVELGEKEAKALFEQGFAEKHDAKGQVEQATAAPGEKRKAAKK